MKQNMTNKMPEHRRNARRGVALIEAMISIIVLAIGVLGVLGLQLRTMVESQQSANRALAVRLAEDFSERVKNNPDAGNLIDGFNGSGFTGAWVTKTSLGTPTVSSCDAGCKPDDLAAFDGFLWRQSVLNALPNAQVNVFMSTNEQIGILFAWDGNMRIRNDDPDTVTAGNYRTIYGGVQGQDFEATGAAATINCPPAGNPELICHLVYISY